MGGGMWVDSGPNQALEISNNSTISGNYAGWQGGGIFMGDQWVGVVSNVTIADNVADYQGGGLFFYWSDQWKFSNALFSGNQPTNCYTDPNLPSSLGSAGNNLDSDGSCNLNGSGDLTNIDPLLQPLAFNGGPTATRALLPGSPAVDRGNKAHCTATDQRGVVRGAACDIGAFELSADDLVPVRNYYTTHTPYLTWNRVPWATGYQVEVANNKGFRHPEFRSDTLSPDTLSVATSSLPNGLWYWHVRALRNNGQWGAWSPAETMRIDA
jgi:hypothetical protein